MEPQQCSQCTHLIQGWLVPTPSLGAVQCKISCRWWESNPSSSFHHSYGEKWLTCCQVRWQTNYEKRLLDSSCLPSVRPYRWNSTPIGINFVEFDIVSLLIDSILVTLLTPNDDYSCTAPLTSKCCILYIYSTNTGTEYFKHGIYSPFFPLQNAVCFINLTYLVPVLFTIYIQGVLKLKK